jgi:hypothetical protein
MGRGLPRLKRILVHCFGRKLRAVGARFRRGLTVASNNRQACHQARGHDVRRCYSHVLHFMSISSMNSAGGVNGSKYLSRGESVSKENGAKDSPRPG